MTIRPNELYHLAADYVHRYSLTLSEDGEIWYRYGYAATFLVSRLIRDYGQVEAQKIGRDFLHVVKDILTRQQSERERHTHE